MTDSGEYRTITVHKLSPAVGAEIGGVDLAGLTDEQFAEIHRAFVDNGVVFLRDQDITPDQHIAFAERFGEINVNRFFHPVDTHPRIAEVRKEPDQVDNIGAAQLVPILRPLVPQYGHLAAHPASNMLIISDRAANVNRMLRIIRRIDQAVIVRVKAIKQLE